MGIASGLSFLFQGHEPRSSPSSLTLSSQQPASKCSEQRRGFFGSDVLPTPSLVKSFIFWESMEAYTWVFSVFSLFVAAKSYAVRHFTTQIYREAATRATTIRHQPTVHCTLFKMVAAGISKWLKGCSLKIEKKISLLGKAFFLYRVY